MANLQTRAKARDYNAPNVDPIQWGRTLIPNVVAGFSPRSSKGVSGVESKVTSREELAGIAFSTGERR